MKNDREWLLQLATELEDDEALEDGEGDRLRAIAENLKNPTIQVVEQLTSGKRMAASDAPDGWSWRDLDYIFTGNWWGIRLQTGEPFLEQDGNVLLFRQGETSFQPRQLPIYSRMSTLQGVSLIVVFGFMGARRGFTMFRDGEQGPVILNEVQQQLGEAVRNWLKWAHANPVPGWERKQNRPKRPEQQLAL